MKLVITTLCLLCVSSIFGQGFKYPVVLPHGQQIVDFIPENWFLLDSVKGDLNNDQFVDMAFVIQYRDSVRLEKKFEDYTDTVLTNPRIVCICFFNPISNQFDFVQQSNTFILSHDNPNMEEPFQEISILNQVLQIDFQIFMNIGGWGITNCSYKFRYNEEEFILIGADCNSFQRNTGEFENRSYNFLSHKVKVETGSISSESSKITWRKFKLARLKTLSLFISPFTWNVESDFVL